MEQKKQRKQVILSILKFIECFFTVLNNMFLKTSIKWSDKIICSWGRFGTLHKRDEEVIQIIKKYRTPVFHLGLTKNNQPKHLLYISYNKILTKWL